ncbi:selenite/tellurite reduction operon porin ExtI [Desulfococcus sp.]|uniref:selenite/tellurite reduction operon porin ExtI n=1 Tax=Desulfococcus sp. TaxID=2025834 RepID=UPI003D10ACA6
MKRTFKATLFLLTCICWAGSLAWGGYKFTINEETRGEIGFWTQGWYQYVENGRDSDNDGVADEGVNDFMIRRAYLSLKGEIDPYLEVFTHIASDRIGQDGLDRSSLGLGSGVAFRDLWITFKMHEAFKLQVGRMYVPFTRNYGTTSTMSLMTTDLDWTQGGVRGNIFYPSKVGRDDGGTLWGNVMDGKFQYRLMVSEGVEDSPMNPDDNLRFAGRFSVNLFDPETDWFNQGTYLGKKRILALGLGGDYQEELRFGDQEDDYFAWTADLHYDQPIGTSDAVTVEGAYIDIKNGPNSITYTQFVSGNDGSIISLKAGYLFSGKIGIGSMQPFAHYEYIDVDENGKEDTAIYGLGLNYFIKGHANKLSMDLSFVDQDEEIKTADMDVQDHLIFTIQLAAGF